MPSIIEPVPGDPSTEPVATAEQSHAPGRVGPPTIAQDAAADYYAPKGVEQIKPGEERPAETVAAGGALPRETDDQSKPEPARPPAARKS
jgi:hypothetical protein